MAFDRAQFFAGAPAALQKAQRLLEDAAEAFGLAADREAELTKEYRQAKAEAFKSFYDKKITATAAKPLVEGLTADLKGNLLKAIGDKRKALLMHGSFQERIYNIRHLCKSIESEIKG